jgi:TRAP-type C4-dicarboxylate transport system substrate-binding protein
MKTLERCSKFVIALFALLAIPGAACAQTKIRLATLLPRGTSQYQALEKMGQDWRTASNGAVTLTIYGDGTMGTEAESVQRLRIGQLQAVTLSAAGLSEIDPYLAAIEKVPMLFRSLEEAEYVRDQIAPELEKHLEQKGFVALFWADAGWIQVFSRNPILRPSDLKRTRLLATPGDPAEIDLIRALEILPVERAWSDALLSLETGAVDTLVTTPFLCLASQFDRTAKHYLALNYVPLAGATIISKKTWDALTPKQREDMSKAAIQAGKQIQASSRAENNSSVDAMKKRGLQAHAVPADSEKEWRAYFEAVYPRVRGNLVPADIFDEVQRLLADYRGAASKGGHL